MSAGGEHIVSPKVYVVIWLTLLFFTGLTVAAAFGNFGILNPIIALAIATTKAVLVVLFFMHVKYSGRMTALVIFCGLFFLSILMVLLTSDYISRSWAPSNITQSKMKPKTAQVQTPAKPFARF